MKRFPDKCPHYQGVCGLNESYVCYCSDSYLYCSFYKEHEQETLAHYYIKENNIPPTQPKLHGRSATDN